MVWSLSLLFKFSRQNLKLHSAWFKFCLRRVGDLSWRESLTMVPAGIKAKRLSTVNHTSKTIYHHHHHHHHHHHYGWKHSLQIIKLFQIFCSELLLPETVVRRSSVEKVFLKFSQNSKEDTDGLQFKQ